jgi:hypothetical protein
LIFSKYNVKKKFQKKKKKTARGDLIFYFFR